MKENMVNKYMTNDLHELVRNSKNISLDNINDLNNSSNLLSEDNVDIFRISNKTRPSLIATALLKQLRHKGRVRACSVGIANKTALKVFAFLESFLDENEKITYKHNLAKSEDSNRIVISVDIELIKDSTQEYKIFTLKEDSVESLVNNIVNNGFL